MIEPSLVCMYADYMALSAAASHRRLAPPELAPNQSASERLPQTFPEEGVPAKHPLTFAWGLCRVARGVAVEGTGLEPGACLCACPPRSTSQHHAVVLILLSVPDLACRRSPAKSQNPHKEG